MGIYSKQINNTTESSASLRQQRKQEALELARILYDIYKKRKDDVRIKEGQNDANESKKP